MFSVGCEKSEVKSWNIRSKLSYECMMTSYKTKLM